MAAWRDDLSDLDRDQRDLRLEANTPDDYDGSVFYDISLADLCAEIDAATADSERLADELHELTGLIERKAA